MVVACSSGLFDSVAIYVNVHICHDQLKTKLINEGRSRQMPHEMKKETTTNYQTTPIVIIYHITTYQYLCIYVSMPLSFAC